MNLERYRNSDQEKVRTADLLRILPRGRTSVLDIGTRDGYFSKLLTNYFSEVTALDLQQPPFEYPGVTTVAGDATKLQFADGSFDCVFCAEVLEHIPELEQACREIVRVSRQDVVIGVPFQQDTRLGRTRCVACDKVNPPWGHVNRFDERSLMELFPGLRVVSKSFVGVNRDVTNWLATYLMDLAGNPWGTYGQQERCVHCGGTLVAPREERTAFKRLYAAAALGINVLQQVFTPPHSSWIHIVLSKNPR